MHPAYAREEEIANSLSHGFGLLAAVVATPFLIDRAMRHGDAGLIVGASVTACHYLAVLWYAA